MSHFEWLPTPVFLQICFYLTSAKDIFSLQSTCLRIRRRIRDTYWSKLQRMKLVDWEYVLLYTRNTTIKVPALLSVLQCVCENGYQMTDIDLRTSLVQDEKSMIQLVKIIRKEVRVINKLTISYSSPETIYSSGSNAQYRNTNKDLIKDWRSMSSHWEICNLIGDQSANLSRLHIEIEDRGLVLLNRYSERELHVELEYFDLTQDMTLVLHHLFSQFVMDGHNDIKILRIGVKFENLNRLRQALLLCIHNSFPVTGDLALQEIHCRTPSELLPYAFDCSHFRPQLRRTLQRVVWHTNDGDIETPSKTFLTEILPQMKPTRELSDTCDLDPVVSRYISCSICDMKAPCYCEFCLE